jgi:hypothetical protein
MRKVCTLVLAGCVSFMGFSVYAQFPMSPAALGGFATPSFMAESVIGQFIDTLVPMEQQTSAIEGPLVVYEAEIPEVNQAIAEVIDSRTGRYLPRLKIDFTEFPLRTLVNGTDGRISRNGTSTDVLIQRIQNRLRVSQIDLTVENRVATVSGTVATKRQRSLVESMLHFEPGIDTVKNEIITLEPF